MSGASLANELLASSLETVAIEGGTVAANRSTVVLKSTAATFRSRAADGLV